MIGRYPYSWGGGNRYGPTDGICCSPGGQDGSRVFGFDCSGLTQYAFYEGAGISIGGTSRAQYDGLKVPLAQRRAGDLIFWSSNGTSGGIHHVALYVGGGQIIEAANPSSGLRKRGLKSDEQDELMAYAVRPIR